MPIMDPSIYQNAFHPTVALQDPTESMAKTMNMANAMQMQSLQLKEKRQQMADAQSMRDAIAEANGDPEALKQALLKRGKVKEVHEMATAEKQSQEAGYKAIKARQEAVSNLNGQQLTALQSAHDAIVKQPDQAQAIWEQTRAQLTANAAPYSKVLGIDTSKTDDPVQFPGLDFLKGKINQNMTFAQRIDQAKAQSDLDYKAWQQKHGDTVASEQERHNRVMEKKPTAATIYNNMPGVDGDLTRHPLYAQAQSISDYKQPMPTRQGPQAAALNELVAKIRQQEGKPAYDATKYNQVKRSMDYFSGGGKGAVALTSNDTLFGHGDEVLESLKEAGTNDVRALNTVNQWISRQTGQDSKYKTLSVAAKVYGGELAKMLGEGSMEERKQIMDLFNNVDSPASFTAAVKQAQKMAATKSAALGNQFYRETGVDPVEAGIMTDRVARGAADSVAARGYKWAEKYRSGAGESKPPEVKTGGMPYAGKTLPKATFDKLSDDDKRKFISGGGRAN